MADTATVVEGKIKYREGKKWKSRWCVLKKPSPVADCLQLLLYKDVHESLRAGGRVKTSLMLEGYYGLESGFSFDKEVNVLAIICQKHIAVMAFDNRENLILFEVKIRRSLGQEFQFPVQLVKVPSGSRLSVEGVRLLIHGLQFCLTAHVPPRILHSWNVTDLRRFGTVDGKFCFEGGSRCGKGTGAHALQTDQAEEITEILRLNSLGSSSASFKPSNNRSSQLLDYSLASPEALWTPPGAHSPGPDRTGMLACCHGVASAEDEFGCRKRHSVSVTDFHRSGAASFQDKLRLMSIENLERQRLMAIYDVPPKYPRKLVESSHSSKPDSESALESSNDAASSDPAWKSSVQQHSAVVGSDQCHVNKHTGHLQGNTVPIRTARVITSPNGREYCIPRSLNTTVFDSIVNAQVDSTKRTEALQKLQKQESHLHQEIILLDQMLQGCHPEGDAETLSINTCGSLTLKKDLAESEIHSMEHSSCSSTPAQITQKAASLPPKIGASIRKETYYSTGQAGHLNSLSDNCMLPLKEQDRNGDLCGSPLSPHLRSKLEKIPLNSHLNTPLPYVNLAKYDQEMDSGHVYLPGNGSSDGSHVALGHRLHRNLVGGSLANLGASRGRVGITPSRCFSETHIGPGPLDQKRVSSVHPSSKNNAAAAAEEFKLSGNILQEMDDIPPPTTYAPPVPYPRPHTATVTAAFSLDLDSPPSTQAPPVPSSPSLIVSFPQREPIYANEPVSSPPVPPPRKRSSTPPLELPPELPPKGPVLLRKTKQRSQGFANINNDFTPPVPARSRSRSVGSQGKFYGHDNSPVPNSPTSSVSDAGSVQMEENYLSMGSPKSQPRSKAKECLQSNGKETETVLIPATVFITNSPKTRCRGVSAAVSRGNADVLSGYMDMANMFVEETKTDSISNRPKLEPPQPKELHNSEEVDSSQVNAFGESNYMEMSTFSPHPPHPPQRKSVVLKNLEVLQTYVSTTPAGEFTRTSYNQVFSTSNLSTEHDNIPIYGARPAIPFTNLKSFEQKQNKSYVNTFIPSREYNVPLPEPPKKEEGFFARLMRRNSKDKGTTHSQENLNATKNRTSVFERSLSEQGDQEEKTNYKLKLGRRRSASFPNRLSFQETSPTATAPSKRDAPPPLPPSLPKPTTPVGASQSLCIHAEESSNQSNASTSRGAAHQSNPTDTSSVHDLSDDSDLAPLLKANVSKSELQVLTVLHMQQDIAVPLARTCSDLTAYKITHSSLSSSESSKTDDEKLQDLKRQSLVTDIAEIKAKMTLPLGKPMLSAKEEAKAIALHVASIPPFIPPKMKKTQLSPVTEVGSPVGHTQSPPLLSSSSHPHPLLPSAPNQDEAIYVDMKELLPQRGPALPAAASLHPYNCPREQKQRARATLRITPAVQDEDGNIWVPRHDPDPGEIRPLPLALADPPPPLPGISPKLPFSLSSPSSPRLGDVASNLLELRYSTPLVVSMDPLEDAEEGLADCLSISSDGSSTCFEDTPIRSSPAATVLRPRSGRDYQVIERRCKVSGSVSSSPVVQSPTVSNVFIYEGSFPAPTSPRSPSISSRLSQERELSPTYKSGLVKHSLGTTSSLTRNQSTVLSWCNESSQFHDGSSVHKVSRTCHLAQSEPCSSQVESSGITVPCVKSSSPISVQAPSPSSPEVQEPMLNYAEIDLSGASSPPPLEISLSKRAKRTPKPAVISYTEIDHRATTALQAAGREHALSREDTLRRTSGFTRKASVPSTPKDRKGSSNSFRDRKLSTCSSDSV